MKTLPSKRKTTATTQRFINYIGVVYAEKGSKTIGRIQHNHCDNFLHSELGIHSCAFLIVDTANK
jgi:hypothetical protein